MTPRQAIRQHYGVRLGPTPADGKYRSFAIDELRNGFLIEIDEFAVFGSIIDAERIVFDGKSYFSFEVEHKEHKDAKQEWLIWEAARSMLERGERLNRVDSERLALAVQRLEMWL
jgi:hypothetical protein